MKELRMAAIRLVDGLSAAGASGAEVLLVDTLSHSGSSIHGMAPPTSTLSAHVRVYDRDGRCGVSQRVIPSLDAASEVAQAALQASARAPAGQEAGPPERLDIQVRGLSIEDPRQERITEADRGDVLDSNVEMCRGAVPGLRELRFSYDEQRLTRAFASSAGVEAVERGSVFRLVGRARIEGGAERVQAQVASRRFSDVASKPLGIQIGRRLMSMRKRVDLPDGPLPLVFSQPAAARIVSALAPAFQATLVDAGGLFLSGQMGERLGAGIFHLIDDATIPGALQTRAFDERGVPPVPVPLVREGVAASLYRSPASALLVRGRPTGHQRTDGSLWSGNLVVRPGNRSRNMIFPLLGRFVIIEALDQAPALDMAAGTLELRGHVFVADAERVHGFSGVHTLRVGVAELLGGITHMLSDHERHGAVDTPSWVVEGPWFG